jgi:hypothetical protein
MSSFSTSTNSASTSGGSSSATCIAGGSSSAAGTALRGHHQRRVQRLSRISYDFLCYNDSVVSASSTFASMQLTTDLNLNRDLSPTKTTAEPEAATPSPLPTQYLAESPFSCQTSIVPVTRDQFYLVVQINMNRDSSSIRSDGNEEEEEKEEDVLEESGLAAPLPLLSFTGSSSSLASLPLPLPPPPPPSTLKMEAREDKNIG